MGACYSKGSASAKHLKLKAPKFRKHDSKNKSDPVLDVELEQQLGDDSFEQPQESVVEGGRDGDSNCALLPLSNGFPDLVSDLDDHSGDRLTSGQAGIGDKGVAPSDSGIESIGLVAVEEGVLTQESSANLSTKIERLSRGSCHKCGNFKLDDNALTALLSNTYCLCGPRQAGKPSVNPDCQTHGVKKDFKRSQSMPAGCGGGYDDGVCASPSPLKSNLKKSCDSGRKEKTLRISLENNLDREIDYSNNLEDDLAQLSKNVSTDNVFEDDSSGVSKEQKRLSRHSLLSEILDITDSICKCDFYSNEYCCVPHGNSVGIDNDKTECVDDTLELESLALSGSASASNCDVSNQHYSDRECPSKKSASMSKFVTFAQENGSGMYHGANDSGEDGSRSCPMSPLKRPTLQTTYYHKSVSETSSGVDMQSADVSAWSMSKSENQQLMASPSYEAVDRTEDDMASIDMDSLSRVTSLSYGSIRHLLESTEDLVGPLDSVRRMTIDGEDCVIIPTNTYKQMQSDLTLLKDQLMCLSSLLQEVCGDARAGRENDPRNRKSLSFYSDLDATPKQRRIQFRSQEFVDMLKDQ